MNMDIVIRVQNLSKQFTIGRKGNSLLSKLHNIFSFEGQKVQALKNVNFDVKKGEVFGIVGRNGSGKSTLIRLLMGSINPDNGGKINTNGRKLRLALGMGFDPNLTARDNIYLNGSILGLTFLEIGKIFNSIIEFAELQDFVDTPIKFFSSGMKSRLSFSIAINAKADILLIDEFFGGVGDVQFKKKSGEIFKKAFLNGRTIVFVSHNLNTIKNYCDRVMILNKGEVVNIGNPDLILKEYNNLFK